MAAKVQPQRVTCRLSVAPLSTLMRCLVLAVGFWGPSARVAHAGLQTLPTSLQQAILTSVLQGTQSVRLPASAQQEAYRFDPDLDLFVRSSRPGPSVLRSPETLRAGSWSARMATSYFELNGDLWSTTYKALGTDFVTKFGSLFRANVTLVEIAAGYGVTDHLELAIGIPITIVSLSTRYRWLYDAGKDPLSGAGGAPTLRDLELEEERGNLLEATKPTKAVPAALFGSQRFDDGTQAGLGQVSLGGKYRLIRRGRMQISPSDELLLPSPNENQFAGPASVGMTARVISSMELAEWATSFIDAGYTYQVKFPELTGFVWNAGVSASPIDRLSVDLGAGGTLFSKGITKNPPVTGDKNGSAVYVATSDTQLGTNAVNALFGFKVRLTDAIAASGGVVVPVTNDGIRPDAAGSIAIEGYF